MDSPIWQSTVNNQNAVLVLLGKGDGTFKPPVSYPVGTSPMIATTMQSRGNGIADLAILSQVDNSADVLIGNGDGTFLPQATYSLSIMDQSPTQLASADLTGDGPAGHCGFISSNFLDLIPTFAVLAGSGDGTYQPLVSYGMPGSNAIADFNRDGVSDLAASNSGSFTINILLSGRQATVPLTTVVYGTGTQQLISKYLGDSNYASSTSNTVAVTGQGPAPTPTFTVVASPSSLAVAAGMMGTATLSVTPQNGFNSVVTFKLLGSAC